MANAKDRLAVLRSRRDRTWLSDEHERYSTAVLTLVFRIHSFGPRKRHG